MKKAKIKINNYPHCTVPFSFFGEAEKYIEKQQIGWKQLYSHLYYPEGFTVRRGDIILVEIVEEIK